MFRKLDSHKTGCLNIEVLRRFFNGGQRSVNEDWPGLYECLQPSGRTQLLSYAVSLFLTLCGCVTVYAVCRIGSITIMESVWKRILMNSL